MHLGLILLCASASLREMVLVAAEGRDGNSAVDHQSPHGLKPILPSGNLHC